MAPGLGIEIDLGKDLFLTHIPVALREELIGKLKIPNPKYIENERMGRWNQGTPRELKFYETAGSGGLRIPRGYTRQLIYACRRMNISYRISDMRRALPEVDFTFTPTLKPFQMEAANVMLAREFGTLSSPTGSGKTLIALYMIARRRQPALVMVHTRELALQWRERIGSFLKIPEEEIGLVGAGGLSVGARITVALVQSLYKHAGEIRPRIGHLVVDECHRTPSRTFTEAVSAFDSKYMLGLSATPFRRDGLSKLIFWHLGDVHHEVDRAELVESGDVLSPEVVVRETAFKPYHDPVREYSRMLAELVSDDARNRLIASDAAETAATAPGVCLILSDRKAHCRNLQALLRYRFKIEAELLTGDLSAAERRGVLDRLSRGEVKILIATGQLIGEGFDCPELSTLFLTTPIRFSGRVLQYLGRVLRPSPGKRKARVFDYVDVKVEPLRAAAAARQRVYHTPLIKTARSSG
jgi:superfamily II DNA or RNA helicase